MHVNLKIFLHRAIKEGGEEIMIMFFLIRRHISDSPFNNGIHNHRLPFMAITNLLARFICKVC